MSREKRNLPWSSFIPSHPLQEHGSASLPPLRGANSPSTALTLPPLCASEISHPLEALLQGKAENTVATNIDEKPSLPTLLQDSSIALSPGKCIGSALQYNKQATALGTRSSNWKGHLLTLQK